ncbi:unnamed protein product [Caenorhabditis angaria]|uniref:Serpentine Receptor, class H n=1 Tax=Caenorhabditis angaria TaxID=860376 RepID=A0A9P1IMK8_9PELO|nr:unnamed protein product [Caenorhabditis angaria]
MCYDSKSILNSPFSIKIIFWIITILSIFIHVFGAFCIIRKTPKTVQSARFWLFNFHLWGLFLDVLIGFAITPYLFLPTLAFRAFGFLEGYEKMVPYFAILTFAETGYSLVLLLENRLNSLTIGEVTRNRQIFRAIFYFSNIIFPFLFPLIIFAYIPDQEIAKIEVIKTLPCLSEIPNIFIIVTDLNSISKILIVFSFALFLVSFQCIILTFLMLKAFNSSENRSSSKSTIALQRKFITSIFIQKWIPLSSLLPPVFYAVFCVFNNYHWQKMTNFLIFVINSHGIIGSLAMIYLHKNYRTTVINLIFRRRIKETLFESEQSKITKVIMQNNKMNSNINYLIVKHRISMTSIR